MKRCCRGIKFGPNLNLLITYLSFLFLSFWISNTESVVAPFLYQFRRHHLSISSIIWDSSINFTIKYYIAQINQLCFICVTGHNYLIWCDLQAERSDSPGAWYFQQPQTSFQTRISLCCNPPDVKKIMAYDVLCDPAKYLESTFNISRLIVYFIPTNVLQYKYE